MSRTAKSRIRGPRDLNASRKISQGLSCPIGLATGGAAASFPVGLARWASSSSQDRMTPAVTTSSFSVFGAEPFLAFGEGESPADAIPAQGRTAARLWRHRDGNNAVSIARSAASNWPTSAPAS